MTDTPKFGTWYPIASAPDFDRIFVCGWQPRHGNVDGYWWWHEDVACNGRAISHPDATHWCAIVLPTFPEPPQ